MRVIDINTREVIFEDATYAVYVIAVEDTNEAFEAMADIPGLVEWQGMGSGYSEEEAINKVSELNL